MERQVGVLLAGPVSAGAASGGGSHSLQYAQWAPLHPVTARETDGDQHSMPPT